MRAPATAGPVGDRSVLLHSALQALLSETSPPVQPTTESATAQIQHDASARDDDGGHKRAPSGDLSGSGSEASHTKCQCDRKQQDPHGKTKRPRMPTYYVRKVRTHLFA